MHHIHTYHTQLYRNFRAINPAEYRNIVYFYEKYEKNILALEFSEYFDLLTIYTNALFEIGEFQKHLLMADTVIETSIIENITEVRGEDIYQVTLFKKAASYYNLFDYEKAIYVLKELIKIEPNDPDIKHFLERCFLEQSRGTLKRVRAVAVVLFLLSALIIFVEVLFIRNFYPKSTHIIEISRNLVFIAGVLVLGIGEFRQRYKAQLSVSRFVKSVIKQKMDNLNKYG